jgi:hypothetical protein
MFLVINVWGTICAQMLLAFSNFLPFALTYGLVWEPGRPGAGPKCFLTSLSLGPLRRRVFVPINHLIRNLKEKVPVGARSTS